MVGRPGHVQKCWCFLRGIGTLGAGDITSLAKHRLAYKVLLEAQGSLGEPNQAAYAEASETVIHCFLRGLPQRNRLVVRIKRDTVSQREPRIYGQYAVQRLESSEVSLRGGEDSLVSLRREDLLKGG